MYDTSHQPETMQVRYKFLPRNITELFEYGTVGLVVDEATKEFELTDEKKAALLMEIELILFFFITRKGLVERLRESMEIDQGQAMQIAAKIENDLFSLIDSTLQVAEAEFESNVIDDASKAEGALSDSTPAVTQPMVESLVPENLIVEPKLRPNSITEQATTPVVADVKPMRTFPDDFNAGRAHSYGAFRPEGNDNDPDEPTHSTSQDDIIKK